MDGRIQISGQPNLTTKREYDMLNEKEVLTRAVRWYVLALLAEEEKHPQCGSVFSKAHAYIAVLGWKYHASSGRDIQTRDAIKNYAYGLVTLYNLQKDHSIGKWMDLNISLKGFGY